VAADTVEIMIRKDEIVMVPLVHGQPRDFMSHAHYPREAMLDLIFEDAVRYCGVDRSRIHVRKELNVSGVPPQVGDSYIHGR
jgi:hypothetical protein